MPDMMRMMRAVDRADLARWEAWGDVAAPSALAVEGSGDCGNAEESDEGRSGERSVGAEWTRPAMVPKGSGVKPYISWQR